MLPSFRRKLAGDAKKNASLRDILKSTGPGTEVLSVKAISGGIHNTEIKFKFDAWKNGIDDGSRPRYQTRANFYNRLPVDILLAGEVITATTTAGVIDELNKKGYDFTTDDIVLEGGVVKALPNSLGYYNSSDDGGSVNPPDPEPEPEPTPDSCGPCKIKSGIIVLKRKGGVFQDNIVFDDIKLTSGNSVFNIGANDPYSDMEYVFKTTPYGDFKVTIVQLSASYFKYIIQNFGEEAEIDLLWKVNSADIPEFPETEPLVSIEAIVEGESQFLTSGVGLPITLGEFKESSMTYIQPIYPDPLMEISLDSFKGLILELSIDGVDVTPEPISIPILNRGLDVGGKSMAIYGYTELEGLMIYYGNDKFFNSNYTAPSIYFINTGEHEVDIHPKLTLINANYPPENENYSRKLDYILHDGVLSPNLFDDTNDWIVEAANSDTFDITLGKTCFTNTLNFRLLADDVLSTEGFCLIPTELVNAEQWQDIGGLDCLVIRDNASSIYVSEVFSVTNPPVTFLPAIDWGNPTKFTVAIGLYDIEITPSIQDGLKVYDFVISSNNILSTAYSVALLKSGLSSPIATEVGTLKLVKSDCINNPTTSGFIDSGYGTVTGFKNLLLLGKDKGEVDLNPSDYFTVTLLKDTTDDVLRDGFHLVFQSEHSNHTHYIAPKNFNPGMEFYFPNCWEKISIASADGVEANTIDLSFSLPKHLVETDNGVFTSLRIIADNPTNTTVKLNGDPDELGKWHSYIADKGGLN